MTDIVIISLVAIVLFVAIRSTVKKSKEKSSCCSGGTYKARPRKLSSVACKKVFYIEGMSCQHCVNRVMEAINSMESTSAEVCLKKGTATVSSETDMNVVAVRVAIEKAGYTVTDIQ